MTILMQLARFLRWEVSGKLYGKLGENNIGILPASSFRIGPNSCWNFEKIRCPASVDRPWNLSFKYPTSWTIQARDVLTVKEHRRSRMVTSSKLYVVAFVQQIRRSVHQRLNFLKKTPHTKRTTSGAPQLWLGPICPQLSESLNVNVCWTLKKQTCLRSMLRVTYSI